MQFWSKGLGNRTVSLRLSGGEAVKSGDRLYVRGRTEEPVVWDYIMPLKGADFTEFLALLREPRIIEYLYHSPHRWRLYRTLLVGGARFLWLLAVFMLVGRRTTPPPEPTIEVPPPSKRRPREARSTADRLGRLTTRSSQRRIGTDDDSPEDDDVDDAEVALAALEVTDG
jgi:hypothetical protein